MRAQMRDTIRLAAIALALIIVFGSIGIAIQRDNRADAIAPITPPALDTTRQDLLVDAAWLANELDSDSPPVIIDVSDIHQYALEHIPNAIHLWWQDTMNLNGAGYGEAFSLSAPGPYRPDIGATQDQAIVVYDNMASKYASRVVWQLRTSGYPQAVVLDGGLAAWKGAGHGVSSTETSPNSTAEPAEVWVAANEMTTEELSGSLDLPDVVVLDTRNETQRHDTVNNTIREGQIPGSVWLPAASFMRDDGTFRSAQELADLFVGAGLTPDQTIVVYGRFGVESGQGWLALRLAGYDNVRVYDDGYLAWGYDTALPVEPVFVPTTPVSGHAPAITFPSF